MGGLTPKVLVEKIEVPKFESSSAKARLVIALGVQAGATALKIEGGNGSNLKEGGTPLMQITPSLANNSGVRIMTLTPMTGRRTSPDPIESGSAPYSTNFLVSDEEGGVLRDYFPELSKAEGRVIRANEARRMLKNLEEKRQVLFKRLASLGEVQGSARGYPSDVLLRDVEAVLDRAYPLVTITQGSGQQDNVRLMVDEYMTAFVQWSKDIYPAEWEKAQGRNPFNGEFFFKQNDKGKIIPVDGAEYRFARMLHNVKARKPLLGELSKEEKEQVVNFVERVLKVVVETFEEAQETLRELLIALTPEVQKGLKAADLPLRTSLLDAFFGPTIETELPDLNGAFRLARFLGELGFYREIGLSLDISSSNLRTFLTLGDLNGVTTSQDRFGLLHTHSLVFSNHRQRVMGWQDTMAPEAGKELRATALVIFSDKDIEHVALEAKKLHEKGVAVPLLYDPKSRTYRNWVQHPYGFSFVAMELHSDGTVKKIHVKYAVYEKEGLANTHAAQAQKLKTWMEKRFSGAEVTLEKVGVEELEAESTSPRPSPL